MNDVNPCDRFGEMLSRQLDGDLSPDETAELVAHLATCPACQRLASEMSATVLPLKDLAATPIPAAYLQEQLESLEREGYLDAPSESPPLTIQNAGSRSVTPVPTLASRVRRSWIPVVASLAALVAIISIARSPAPGPQEDDRARGGQPKLGEPFTLTAAVIAADDRGRELPRVAERDRSAAGFYIKISLTGLGYIYVAEMEIDAPKTAIWLYPTSPTPTAQNALQLPPQGFYRQTIAVKEIVIIAADRVLDEGERKRHAVARHTGDGAVTEPGDLAVRDDAPISCPSDAHGIAVIHYPLHHASDGGTQ